MITFDPKFSVELCGGTHVPATGVIGLFKIVSESSIAAGVRRIEAITAKTAEDFVNSQLELIKEIGDLLKSPRDLKKSVETLVQERNELKKEIELLHAQQAAAIKQQLIAGKEQRSGFNLIIAQVNLPSADSLKKLAYELKNEVADVVVVLAAEIEGKPQIAVILQESLVDQLGLNAGQMVRDLAKEIQGGGGGQPFFATAGGKQLAGLPKVVQKAKEMFAGR